MDKMNSQPKSSNTSVGSDQPIEVPDNNQTSNASEEHQHHAEPSPQARPTPATTDTNPPMTSHRVAVVDYYEDSDDMIERVRRARAAFERKANAFQGPDWPHYDKRIIVGKKTKEEFLAEQAQNSASTLPIEPDKAKEQPCDLISIYRTSGDGLGTWRCPRSKFRRGLPKYLRYRRLTRSS